MGKSPQQYLFCHQRRSRSVVVDPVLHAHSLTRGIAYEDVRSRLEDRSAHVGNESVSWSGHYDPVGNPFQIVTYDETTAIHLSLALAASISFIRGSAHRPRGVQSGTTTTTYSSGG